MYQIRIWENIPWQEIQALAMLFLPREAFTVTTDEALGESQSFSVVFEGREIALPQERFFYRGCPPSHPKEWKNAVKRGVYETLALQTGYRPPWGILTGVKPVKIIRELEEKGMDLFRIRSFMEEYYLLEGEKNQLLLETLQGQASLSLPGDERAIGLYVGIPFCPTRCVYCSFPSNVASQEQVALYLEALEKEIDFTAEGVKELGLWPDCVYIGGGTPTSLSPLQLDRLFDRIFRRFDLSGCREFTLEAGRPDTITKEKLKVIRDWHIGRISINPQSMNQKTLRAIGRAHSPDQIKQANEMAREAGIGHINMDVIAGLPGEEAADFVRTLQQVLNMSPENLTVHTLAVKRASRLRQEDEHYNFKKQASMEEMIRQSRALTRQAGYIPYYLYRQKYMVGNYENVGYAKPGQQCVYNIRTMDERQTMIALGAGGISKICFPRENRIERSANVSNYEIYIQRIDQMLQRKKQEVFLPLKEDRKEGF